MENLLPLRVGLNRFIFLDGGIAETMFEFLVVVGRPEPLDNGCPNLGPGDTRSIDESAFNSVPGGSLSNQVDREVLDLEGVGIPAIGDANHFKMV